MPPLSAIEKHLEYSGTKVMKEPVTYCMQVLQVKKQIYIESEILDDVCFFKLATWFFVFFCTASFLPYRGRDSGHTLSLWS